MSGRPYAFDRRQCERIARLYVGQKQTVETIAVRFNSNAMAVWRTLKRQGVEIRPNPRQRTAVDTKEIIRLYTAEKVGTNEIGEMLGMHGESIRIRLRQAGVEIRTKSDAAKLKPSEWTDERLTKLPDLWNRGLSIAEIKAALGISYGEKSISLKARALGLQPRGTGSRPRTASEISVFASATREAKFFVHQSLISFPESPQLQADWEHVLAAVRAERGSAWPESGAYVSNRGQ